MDHEAFEREKRYGICMALVREMLRDGVVSDKEFRQIDTMFIKKFRPPIAMVFPKKP